MFVLKSGARFSFRDSLHWPSQTRNGIIMSLFPNF